MNSTPLLQLPVPLHRQAHILAAQFAAEQSNPEKRQRVYLNTLAVYAVHTYLKWLEIDTPLEQGDSWQPGLRSLLNAADLVVPGVGKLECCPVLPGDRGVMVSEDVVGDRVGYIAVKFDQPLDSLENLESVELLGFVRDITIRDPQNPVVEPQEIPLDDFTNLGLDPLLNVIYAEEAIVVLQDWLEHNFKHSDWKPLELLVPSRFRSSLSGSRGVRGGTSSSPELVSQLNSVSRAKVFELGRSPDQTVVLVVQVSSVITGENNLSVKLRLYPDDTSDYLPPNLRITVLDEAGSVILESQPKEQTVWTELELLDCHPNERFSVRIALNECVVIEDFRV